MNYNDDIIDSRDLYKRQCELQDLKNARETAEDEYNEAVAELSGNEEVTILETERLGELLQTMQDAQDEFSEPERAELVMLEVLENEITDYMHGTTLVHEHYFATYAKQYAEDIGAIDRDMKWPYTCIDWEEAAGALQGDFTEVEIDGTSYYYS